MTGKNLLIPYSVDFVSKDEKSIVCMFGKYLSLSGRRGDNESKTPAGGKGK